MRQNANKVAVYRHAWLYAYHGNDRLLWRHHACVFVVMLQNFRFAAMTLTLSRVTRRHSAARSNSTARRPWTSRGHVTAKWLRAAWRPTSTRRTSSSSGTPIGRWTAACTRAAWSSTRRLSSVKCAWPSNVSARVFVIIIIVVDVVITSGIIAHRYKLKFC